MAISLRCPCGACLKTEERDVRRRVRCPACGRTVLVPAGSPAEAVAAGAVGSGIEAIGREWLEPAAEPGDAPPMAPTNRGAETSVVLRRMFDALLDPRSIQWMLTIGGGLFVLGLLIWLVSWGIFQNPVILAAALGIGTLAILCAGWWVALVTRFRIAGQALTFLGCVVAPLNLWFYHAQDLVTLDNHLWLGGVVCCLLYVATVYVLRDPTLPVCRGSRADPDRGPLPGRAGPRIGPGVSHRGADGAGTDLDPRRAGLSAQGRAVHPRPIRDAAVLVRPRAARTVGADPAGNSDRLLVGPPRSRALIPIVWQGNWLTDSPLLAGALWLGMTYAYLYSDIVVRRSGIYSYLAAFCFLMAEITVVGFNLQMEWLIAILALTALAANLVRVYWRLPTPR